MRSRTASAFTCLFVLAACSSTARPPPDETGDDAGASPSSDGNGGDDGGGATITEHGIVYDYGTLLTSGTLAAVEGLTVTDGTETTTTDANGNWSLTMPASATLSPTVTGTSEGDPYSLLMFPSRPRRARASTAGTSSSPIRAPSRSSRSRSVARAPRRWCTSSPTSAAAAPASPGRRSP